MPESFFLDTNIYSLFFQYPKSSSYYRLAKKIQDGSKLSFYISEITSMEIHSVLGKYRRGSPSQINQCNRQMIFDGKTTTCLNKWIYSGRKKMNRKIFHDFQKLIIDIENQKGDICAFIINLDSSSITIARKLLMKYADRYNFGSHDALIAGSLINARKEKRMNFTLVTSDKTLKAVLNKESIPFYDPRISE